MLPLSEIRNSQRLDADRGSERLRPDAQLVDASDVVETDLRNAKKYTCDNTLGSSLVVSGLSFACLCE
ncbi:hypothetical protein GWI33_009168 [Rhynchophorus ferrugineus]|uniref:Uncharacterized protein n=1 Tax=Rhynchophorus ferrugineus TaxID=354439 RepID=A0A834IB21_RHYFE|nr:hypothetical protein GWI33_009168 [Rhynchophorus ferrugineus]